MTAVHSAQEADPVAHGNRVRLTRRSREAMGERTRLARWGRRLMGIQLANVVSVSWAHLPERQFKVLMRMALTALDVPNKKGQPAHVFWGGWETLALAMNRDVPAEDDPRLEAQTRRRTLVSEVARTTRLLVDAGAIKPQETARRGHQQTWLLTVS